MNLLAALQWDPGFRGLLTVGVGVAVLCGSIFVILATNSGVRLGFMLALSGLMGWMVVMGLVWAMYGIGYKGPAPTWKVVDTVQGSPDQSRVEAAQHLPLPAQLPDAVNLRDTGKDTVDGVTYKVSSKKMLKEIRKAYPATAKDPTIGDLVNLDTGLADQINDQFGPWHILESANKYTGETGSTVAEALGADGENLFPNGASDYVVTDSFLSGGKKGLGDDRSIINRIKYKFTSVFDINHAPFRAAVQLQAVIPQTTKAGQAPPSPVRNEDAPIYTVILERDRGKLRLPSIVFTIVCSVIFAILVNMLHRRDKLATAQRAAGAA